MEHVKPALSGSVSGLKLKKKSATLFHGNTEAQSQGEFPILNNTAFLRTRWAINDFAQNQSRLNIRVANQCFIQVCFSTFCDIFTSKCKFLDDVVEGHNYTDIEGNFPRSTDRKSDCRAHLN